MPSINAKNQKKGIFMLISIYLDARKCNAHKCGMVWMHFKNEYLTVNMYILDS